MTHRIAAAALLALCARVSTSPASGNVASMLAKPANLTTGSFLALVHGMEVLLRDFSGDASRLCRRDGRATDDRFASCLQDAVSTMDTSTELLTQLKNVIGQVRFNVSREHDSQSDKRKKGSYGMSGEMNEKILLRVVSIFWSVRNELLARGADTRSKLKAQGDRDFLDDFDLSVESFAYFLAEIVGTFVGITWGFISSVIAIINSIQEEE